MHTDQSLVGLSQCTGQGRAHRPVTGGTVTAYGTSRAHRPVTGGTYFFEVYKVIRFENSCERDEGRGVVLMWDVAYKHLTAVLHREWLKDDQIRRYSTHFSRAKY